MSPDESSVSRREFFRKSALAGAAAAVSPALLAGCKTSERDLGRAGAYQLHIRFTGLCLFVMDTKDPHLLRVLLPLTGGPVTKHEVRCYSPGWDDKGVALTTGFDKTIQCMNGIADLKFGGGLVNFSTQWQRPVRAEAFDPAPNTTFLAGRINIPGGTVGGIDAWQGKWHAEKNPADTVTLTAAVTWDVYVDKKIKAPIPGLPDVAVSGSHAWIEVRHAPSKEQEPDDEENMGSTGQKSPHFAAYKQLFTPPLDVDLVFDGHVGQPQLLAAKGQENMFGMTPFTCMSGGGGG